jgi:cytidylate kinase
MSTPPIIAIDGPSGSGKGTLAQRIADKLGWHLLDSGALYRIIGAVCELRAIGLDDELEVARLAAGLDIRFSDDRVLVTDRDGAFDLTEEIRTEDAGERASVVAQFPQVRTAVLAMQRNFARPPGLVADGRDMGTVVFPDARLKVFLEASAEVRAQRRYKQLKNKGLSVSLPGLLAQIQERDARDRERVIAPLKPADDAWVLDSTDLSIDEVVDLVFTEATRRGLTS